MSDINKDFDVLRSKHALRPFFPLSLNRLNFNCIYQNKDFHANSKKSYGTLV
jgi:hypothetical protein